MYGWVHPVFVFGQKRALIHEEVLEYIWMGNILLIGAAYPAARSARMKLTLSS